MNSAVYGQNTLKVMQFQFQHVWFQKDDKTLGAYFDSFLITSYKSLLMDHVTQDLAIRLPKNGVIINLALCGTKP